MTKLAILNGPNLNLLGTREPSIYGASTLETINTQLEKKATALGYELECFQSNSEAELINQIHQFRTNQVNLIIANLAAFTHTSIALRDALLAVNIPYIEVHLSNVHAREPFRHFSYFADKALGVITGFGAYSYELALFAAHHYLTRVE